MYHVALALSGRTVVVVGAGRVAERRITGLLAAQAHVVVIAPQAVSTIVDLASAARIVWHERTYAPNDLADAMLVMAATDDLAVNAAVLTEARTRGILCNDASAGELGDFTVPAVVSVGPITFAVETGGSSPSFSKRLRDEIAERFDARYGRAADALQTMRKLTIASIPEARRAAVMARLSAFSIDRLAAMHLGDLENAVEDAAQDDLADRGRLAEFTATIKTCASRRSPLAMTQTRFVLSQLARAGIASTLLEITTDGDTFTDRPITSLGSGAFVNELEQSILRKDADFAVHSCKDLPSTLPQGLAIIAVPKRADPYDVLCSEKYRDFFSLPEGARVGTSSPRRRAQMAALRSDLDYAEIRGNVDTRLAKLRSGEYDAIILAAAGLERIGARATFMQPFDGEAMIPAVAQGALAVEARVDDLEFISTVRRAINHPESEIAVIAERACLGRLGGGCRAPIGVHAQFSDDRDVLMLHAMIATPDGAMLMREHDELDCRMMPLGSEVAESRLRDAARELGIRVAERLLRQGADEILALIAPLRGKRLLLGRTRAAPSKIAAALRDIGAEVFEIRENDGLEVHPETLDAIIFPSSGSVAVVKDRIPATSERESPTLIAAMGPQSAGAASLAGFAPHVVADEADLGVFIHLITRALLEHD